MLGTREGSPQVYKRGSLKRRLPSVKIAIIGPDQPETAAQSITQRLTLRNLDGVLNVHVGVSVVSVDGADPISPNDVPAGASTFQLIPWSIPPDAPRTPWRPVFQDPTQPVNENHPLPMNVPFGWEVTSLSDELDIVVVHDPAVWSASLLPAGFVIVEATLEYDGFWWDTKAIEFAVSQVQLTGVPQPQPLWTGGL